MTWYIIATGIVGLLILVTAVGGYRVGRTAEAARRQQISLDRRQRLRTWGA